MKEIYLDGTYYQMNPTWDTEDSEWKASHVMRMLGKHGLDPNTICEIGCGAGEILRQLHDQLDEKTTYTGYEISPQAIELCKKRESERISFELGDFVTEGNGTKYDLLLVLDVIEHVENYFEFIRGLKEKGEYKLFIIPLELNVYSVLKNIPLKTRQNFGHINCFSKETALHSLSASGYEIIDCEFIETWLASETSRLKWIVKKFLLQVSYTVSQKWASRIIGNKALLVLAR